MKFVRARFIDEYYEEYIQQPTRRQGFATSQYAQIVTFSA